jgi:hypothetical protein
VPTPDRISQAGLNRATLARQMLLERADADVDARAALQRLVGLQAQAPNPPYVGLWTRLGDHFRFDQLTELLQSKAAVRSSAMRGTLHVLTADDFVRFRALLQPLHERYLLNAYRRHLEGIDPAEVAEHGRRFLDEEPQDNGALAAHLQDRWPDRDKLALTNCVRFLVPLVHVPPAGTWGHHRSARLAPVESWLGRPLDDTAGAEKHDLVLRYLAAFGPATPDDVQAWSGLTRVREITNGLADGKILRRFTDDDGRTLLDLPDAPRPAPVDTPAPARLLPDFDNILIGYADRTRIISEEHRKVVFTKNGLIRATIVVDGVVQGMWRIERTRTEATAVIRPFTKLTPKSSDDLEAEARALLPHTDPDAEHRVVVETAP